MRIPHVLLSVNVLQTAPYLPMRGSGPHLTHGSLGRTSPHPKGHLAGVRDADAARSPAGADDVHVRHDVGETTDVAVVSQDAAAEPHATVILINNSNNSRINCIYRREVPRYSWPHATVERSPDDDHRGDGARRAKRLRLAVLALH